MYNWITLLYTWKEHIVKSTICCCCRSVAKSCLTLCDPMDCSMPGSSVLHYLPEFAQIHIHWVGDAIYLTHPLLSPFPITSGKCLPMQKSQETQIQSQCWEDPLE